MDRHSKTAAARVSKAAAWSFLIPVILVIAGVHSLVAQSTLRFLPAPSERPARQTQAVGVQSEQRPAEASALQVVTASEIRIVAPTQPRQLSCSPTVVANDLWAPLSQSSVSSGGPLASNLEQSQTFGQNRHYDATIQEPQDTLARRYQFSPTPGRGLDTSSSGPVAQSQIRVLSPEPVEEVISAQKSPQALESLAREATGESTYSIVVMQQDSLTPLPKVMPKEQPAPVVAVSKPAKPPALPPVVARNPKPSSPALVATAPATSKPYYEPSRTAQAERPSLVYRLFIAGFKDAPAPQQVAESKVAPRTDLMAKLTPEVIAEQFPARSQPRAAAPVESWKEIEKPAPVVATMPVVSVPKRATADRVAESPVRQSKVVEHPVAVAPQVKAAPEPQLVARAPKMAAPAARPKSSEQPKATDLPVLTAETFPPAPQLQPIQAKSGGLPSDQVAEHSAAVDHSPAARPQVVATTSRKELFAAPLDTQLEAAPAPPLAKAQSLEKTPARVATSDHALTSSESLVAATLPQPANDHHSSPASEDAQRVASRYPSQVRKVPATVASTAAAPSNETFTFADQKQPTSSLVVDRQQRNEGDELTLPEVAMDVEPSAENHNDAESGTLVDPMEPNPCCPGGPREPIYLPFGCPYMAGQSGAPFVCGVDCGRCGAPCCSSWQDSRCIPWSLFGPGEYVGPARTRHVPTYYLRVNDLITLTYITSRQKEAGHYRIGCGDRLAIDWLPSADPKETSLNREVLVQPDGTIALPLVGEVTVADKTVAEVNNELTKLYGKYQRDPQITVAPLVVNTGIEDIIRAVTSVSGSNGQSQVFKVTPEGTIQAPGLGSVFVQGLTLDELTSELEARYAAVFGPGLLVSPSLTERATTYAFIGGEVTTPGRYTLEGPTTVMQAIALAGGWNVGGNLRQVVVFRRDDNWCLKAIKIDVRAPYYGHDPCPTNDVWLRDNDLVIVPKSRILCAADVINLYFTRGIYAVFPINFVYDFTKGTAVVPVM